MGLDSVLINKYMFLFLCVGMFLAFQIHHALYKFSYNYSDSRWKCTGFFWGHEFIPFELSDTSSLLTLQGNSSWVGYSNFSCKAYSALTS